jgi:hypothetical protein
MQIKQEGGVFGVQVRAGPQGGVPGLKDGNVIFGGAGVGVVSCLCVHVCVCERVCVR